MASPARPSSTRTPRPFSALPHPARGCRAFTLLEILVVIAIIAILASLVLPMVFGAQRKAYATTSVANLRQWGAAFAASVGDNNNDMPSDGGNAFQQGDETAWFNRMPPRIAIEPLKKGGDALPNIRKKSLWVNPGAPVKEAVGNPPFCYGYNDYLSTRDEPTMKVTRVAYPAKTLLLAEKVPNSEPACTPGNIRSYYGAKDPKDPDAECNILFVDGHVQAVKYKDFTKGVTTAAPNEDALLATPFTWQPFFDATP